METSPVKLKQVVVTHLKMLMEVLMTLNLMPTIILLEEACLCFQMDFVMRLRTLDLDKLCKIKF